MVKNRMTINVTLPEMKELLEECSWNFINIPRNCYTVMTGDVGSQNYEIFYNGEKINDVQGIIRMAHVPVNRIITNWQEEFGDD